MVARVRTIDAGEDGEEMRFGGPNITFGGVASVGMCVWEGGGGASWYVRSISY